MILLDGSGTLCDSLIHGPETQLLPFGISMEKTFKNNVSSDTLVLYFHSKITEPFIYHLILEECSGNNV